MSDIKNAPSTSPTAARIRFGLRFKIILGLTIFNILGTALFATNHYLESKRATIFGIEQKLAAAARALPDMLPPGYLDRVGDPENFDKARRFITLIDALYEHRVKLVASAEDYPDRLYERGENAAMFERTASRLVEMQSQDYLALAHLT